jgi:hypothetical protein
LGLIGSNWKWVWYTSKRGAGCELWELISLIIQDGEKRQRDMKVTGCESFEAYLAGSKLGIFVSTLDCLSPIKKSVWLQWYVWQLCFAGPSDILPGHSPWFAGPFAQSTMSPSKAHLRKPCRLLYSHQPRNNFTSLIVLIPVVWKLHLPRSNKTAWLGCFALVVSKSLQVVF